MATYIPFNHNPASRDIKTAAYTIPAGQYAFVHPLGYDSDFTIDSDVVIPQLSIKDEQTLTADTNDVYSPPDGYHFKGYVSIFETVAQVGGDEYRFAVRGDSSTTSFYFFGIGAASATTYNVNDIKTGIGTGTISGQNRAHGYFPIEIPSQMSLEFDQLQGIISIRTLVFGMLQQPVGAQNMFHVPSGVEVDGSKFEVILFNEA